MYVDWALFVSGLWSLILCSYVLHLRAISIDVLLCFLFCWYPNNGCLQLLVLSMFPSGLHLCVEHIQKSLAGSFCYAFHALMLHSLWSKESDNLCASCWLRGVGWLPKFQNLLLSVDLLFMESHALPEEKSRVGYVVNTSIPSWKCQFWELVQCLVEVCDAIEQ